VIDFDFLRLNIGVIPYALFPIVVGIAVMVLGIALTKRPSMTIVGVIITMLGFILWYQGSTGAYQTWAYAWALIIPTSIGLGFLLHGVVTHQPSLVSRGIHLVVIGMVLFGIGFTFFEFTINLSGYGDSAIGRLVGPVLLIGLGLYLLLRRVNRSPGAEFEVE
jgi:hypothetical protein